MKLWELRRAMGEYARSFDPARVSAREAARIRDVASAIKHMAAGIEAQAAARVADTTVWKKSGERSAAHELAAATGTSVGRARETLDTGRRLQELPQTTEALHRGEISMEQACLVAGAAVDDPDAEAGLLEAARSGSMSELREASARVRANACDRETRRRRIHEQRHLRSWVDGDGAGHLHLRDNPERVAAIVAGLASTRDELMKRARRPGRREPLEAYAADALYELVGQPTRAPRSAGGTKILVRVDLPALLSGRPAGDELCEIAGYGPVAVSAVRDLIDTGDPFLAAVVTKGKAVSGVTHLGRRPTADQRTALEWLYPTCAAEGCSALTFLEFDHREDWSKTKTTIFDLLDRLCGYHHSLKTREGWALEPGHGKRAFVAPDDPRHPRHAEPLAAA